MSFVVVSIVNSFPRLFVLIESTGFGDEDLGEVGEDSPVARFVGMGQIVARDVAANAHVVEPVFHGSQTGYDIAKAFPVGQLGESQAEELPYLFHYVHNGKLFKCNVGTLLGAYI